MKPLALCVCEAVTPIDNKVMVVILQHPQEQDRLLGTARLAALHFKNSLLKIGLSWPSLGRIVGKQVDAQRWAILYLGSVKPAEIAPERDVIAVNRKGQAEEHQGQHLRDVEGIVLLDGHRARRRRFGGATRGCSNVSASFSIPSIPRATATCARSRAAMGFPPSSPPPC